MGIAGTSTEELRYWRYQWKEETEKERLEALREARAKDLNPLTLEHEKLITTTATEETETELPQTAEDDAKMPETVPVPQ